MPFNIIRSDITTVQADAIVNTANPEPVYSSGTDGAIYNAAGAEKLLRERQKIGRIERGQAFATPAFRLKARHIIHTVGPVWQGGDAGEFETLALCYRNSLQLADRLGCESIAFPLIATGVYGFPKDKALKIAVNEIGSFLLEHDMDVTLVVFDSASFVLSGKLFDGIRSLIDDDAAMEQAAVEYDCCADYAYEEKLLHSRRMSTPPPAASVSPSMSNISPARSVPRMSLEEYLAQSSETFQQCLFRMIDERQLTDPEVYRRANLDRKHFSKIRRDKDYTPKKKTALALACALRLDLEQTNELLACAGLTLGPSRFDRIVSYYISCGCYDILTVINPALYKAEQMLLGA